MKWKDCKQATRVLTYQVDISDVLTTKLQSVWPEPQMQHDDFKMIGTVICKGHAAGVQEAELESLDPPHDKPFKVANCKRREPIDIHVQNTICLVMGQLRINEQLLKFEDTSLEHYQKRWANEGPRG